MTWFHVLNLTALALGPYFVVYYASKLSEFRAFLVSLWGFLAMVATSGAKMLILASLLPSGADLTWDWSQELVKAAAGLIDLLGMQLILSYHLGAGTSDVKILGVGLGWSAAETAVMRFLNMFISARSLEFSWNNVKLALLSNTSIVIYISYAALLWLWGRRSSDKERIPLLFATFAIYPVFLFATSLVSMKLSWYFIVLWEIGFSAVIAVVAKHLHSTWGKGTGKKQQ